MVVDFEARVVYRVSRAQAAAEGPAGIEETHVRGRMVTSHPGAIDPVAVNRHSCVRDGKVWHRSKVLHVDARRCHDRRIEPVRLRASDIARASDLSTFLIP